MAADTAPGHFQTLDQWLAWQETLHPRKIDLGLERVRAVAAAMGLERAHCPVVTVGGTNGKGSTVALLEACLRAGGHRVGSYTSPHLVRYNERIRVDGVEAEDAALCAAFERIDRARGDISLSYFEFGTLAALELFRGAAVDVMLLEVGLGGRLDAVNMLDADVAVVTNVALDHMAWLGADRESIGREKAGIYRPARPAICVDPDPPDSLAAVAAARGARWLALGRDFEAVVRDGGWDWRGPHARLDGLPVPALGGGHQLRNAAGALTALACLRERLPVEPAAIARGLAAAVLPGRFQVLPGAVERILDVAHNPAGARALAEGLALRPAAGRTHGVLGVLEDKDAPGLAAALAPVVDVWHLGGVGDDERGLDGEALARRLQPVIGTAAGVHAGVTDAYRAALAAAAPGDRVVVCGSFHSVGAVLALESVRG